MARDTAYTLPPMMLSRFTNEFAEIDYSVPIDNAFDVANYLQTWQKEAGVKGMVVVIQVALVPTEKFYENQPATDEGENEQN